MYLQLIEGDLPASSNKRGLPSVTGLVSSPVLSAPRRAPLPQRMSAGSTLCSCAPGALPVTTEKCKRRESWGLSRGPRGPSVLELKLEEGAL